MLGGHGLEGDQARGNDSRRGAGNGGLGEYGKYVVGARGYRDHRYVAPADGHGPVGAVAPQGDDHVAAGGLQGAGGGNGVQGIARLGAGDRFALQRLPGLFQRAANDAVAVIEKCYLVLAALRHADHGPAYDGLFFLIVEYRGAGH